MKIARVTATPVAMADPPLRNSYGRHSPYALRTIVEVESEDGIVGIGETYAAGARLLQDFNLVGTAMLGRNAFDLARMQLAAATRLSPEGGSDASTLLYGDEGRDVAAHVYGAVEVAVLDMIGKSIGQPLSELLGGRVRDEVPFSAYLFFKHRGGGGQGADAREDRYGEALTPAAVTRQARELVEKYGFKSIKLKGGVLPPDDEIATIESLREALGPSSALRIDPNCAWSIETSVDVGRRLGSKLEYLEDPTSGLHGMAEVRRRLDQLGIVTPLASNEAVTGFADLPQTINSRAAQIILGDHHYWGGPSAITQLGRMCETFDLGLSMHSNLHLGISLLAMTHAAAATPHLSFACDTHYPWVDEADEVITGGKLTIADGNVTVPTAPGLGATLNYDALARGKERFETYGHLCRDSASEMREHVDPNWQRVLPRW